MAFSGNWNNLKTSNLSLFPIGSNGAPAWNLLLTPNWVNQIVDRLAYLFSLLAVNIPTTAPITVTASPFTYTAGPYPEEVYISGGAVSSVKRNGVELGVLGGVSLPPYGSVVVEYLVAPTMVKDVVGIFNNAAGSTGPVVPGASPWTYTAGDTPEVVYISGGSVSSIARNGTNVGTAGRVVLPPQGQLVITYTVAPTVVVDK